MTIPAGLPPRAALNLTRAFLGARAAPPAPAPAASASGGKKVSSDFVLQKVIHRAKASFNI
jgi:hypothetical protein